MDDNSQNNSNITMPQVGSDFVNDGNNGQINGNIMQMLIYLF